MFTLGPLIGGSQDSRNGLVGSVLSLFGFKLCSSKSMLKVQVGQDEDKSRYDLIHVTLIALFLDLMSCKLIPPSSRRCCKFLVIFVSAVSMFFLAFLEPWLETESFL